MRGIYFILVQRGPRAQWTLGVFGLTTMDSIILSSLFASSLFLNVFLLSTLKQTVGTKSGFRRFFILEPGFFKNYSDSYWSDTSGNIECWKQKHMRKWLSFYEVNWAFQVADVILIEKWHSEDTNFCQQIHFHRRGTI